MNKKDLLKNFTIGFLPLLVFILADSIFGTKIGLIVAVIFGICEFALTYILTKIVDKFILFDTALITALGAVSIAFDNPVFFKIKPALINAIFLVIIGLTAFSKSDIIFKMMGRYAKGVKFDDIQLIAMKKMMRTMFFMFFIQTVLIVYSALYMSKEAWAFISGGLFYIMFGFIFILEIFGAKKKKRKYKKMMKKYDKEVKLQICNEDGEQIGSLPKTLAINSDNILKNGQLVIKNYKNDLYLVQVKIEESDFEYWTLPINSFIIKNTLTATQIKEELYNLYKIENANLDTIGKFLINYDENKKRFIELYICELKGKFEPNSKEIIRGRYFKIKELENILSDIEKKKSKIVFDPSFILAYKILNNDI